MTTLYDIPARYEHFYQTMMELHDGEITEDLIQVLDSIDEEFKEKVEACCKMISELKARSEIASKEGSRLISKAKAHENKAKRLSEYVKENMNTMGTTTIENGLFRATVCHNPISVNVYDKEQIPEKFYRSQPDVLSKTDIKTAIESGEPVDGAELIRTTGLRIT
jgi:hypothetical protein